MIGHQRDPVHPFSDADALVAELPNAPPGAGQLDPRAAASRPERLTNEIADFIDECWRPGAAAARRAAPRRLGFRLAAWPIEQRRRNAGARSAWPEEEAARQAADRKRTLQIGGGAVLGLAVIAVVASSRWPAAATSKGDATVERQRRSPPTPRPPAAPSSSSSARAATTRPQGHLQDQPADLGQPQPDAGAGRHLRAGNTPPKENFVHTLEHGRIEFQYKPGTPAADVAKLRRLAEEPLNGTAGYHVLCSRTTRTCPRSSRPPRGRSRSPARRSPRRPSTRCVRSARRFADKGPELIP